MAYLILGEFHIFHFLIKVSSLGCIVPDKFLELCGEWKIVSHRLLCSHVFSCLFGFLLHLDTQGCNGPFSSWDLQWKRMKEGIVKTWLSQNTGISVFFYIWEKNHILKECWNVELVYLFPVWLICFVLEVNAMSQVKADILHYDPVWWYS